MKRKTASNIKAAIFGAAFFLAFGIVGKIDSNAENGYRTVSGSAYGTTIITSDGNEWETEHPVSDGTERKVLITFDTKGTPEVSDDEIVDIY